VRSAQTVTVHFQRKTIINCLGTLLVLGSTLYLLIYKFSDLITSSDGGTAFNWPAAAITFLAFAFLSMNNGSKWYQQLFFLMVSAYFGSNFYTLIYWEDITRLVAGVEVLLLVTMTIFAYRIGKRFTSTRWRFFHYGSLAALLLTFLFPITSMTVLAFCSIIITLMTITATTDQVILTCEV
jgi:hypothetical protein